MCTHLFEVVMCCANFHDSIMIAVYTLSAKAGVGLLPLMVLLYLGDDLFSGTVEHWQFANVCCG